MKYIGDFMDGIVRDVDPKVFRKFKAKTIEAGMKTNTAMTQALKEWVEKRNQKEKAKKKNQ